MSRKTCRRCGIGTAKKERKKKEGIVVSQFNSYPDRMMRVMKRK